MPAWLIWLVKIAVWIYERFFRKKKPKPKRRGFIKRIVVWLVKKLRDVFRRGSRR